MLDGAHPGHLALLDRFLVVAGRIVRAQARDLAELGEREVAHVAAALRHQLEGDRLPDGDGDRIHGGGQRPAPHVAGVESIGFVRLGQRLHLERERLRRAPRRAAREEHAEASHHLDLGGVDLHLAGAEREEGALAQQEGAIGNAVDDARLADELLGCLDLLAPEAVQPGKLQLVDPADVHPCEQVERVSHLLPDEGTLPVDACPQHQVAALGVHVLERVGDGILGEPIGRWRGWARAFGAGDWPGGSARMESRWVVYARPL